MMSGRVWIGGLIITVLSLLAFLAAERRTRRRWMDRERGQRVIGPPYRAVIEPMRSGEGAPWGIRAAALSGIALGGLAVPGTIVVMSMLPFDGIALAFLPVVLSCAAAWSVGWLLLARRSVARDLALVTSLIARASSILLFSLAMLHAAAARWGWGDSASRAYTVLAVVLSLGALAQAEILHRAIARHGDAFEPPA